MALALCALLAFIIAPAYADIYKWTDENGITVMSNLPPQDSGKAKNLKVVLKDASPATPAASARVATPTEQELRSRVDSLERELRARQYVEPAPAIPPLPPAGTYYPSPYPDNYPNDYATYYPTYYPAYYPTYFYPARGRFHAAHSRIAHATPYARVPSQGGAVRAGNGHGGRR